MEFGKGDVNVPVAGKIKKSYILVPAGIAGVYVLYKWYQARQDSSSTGTDTSTSDGTYTTPDQSEYGLSTTGGDTTVTGNTGSTTTDATNGVSTNDAWAQKALDLLTNQGYDGQTVSAALGDFLAHRSLTASEATIARAALGLAGQPPVGGPWSVNEQATTGGTGVLAAPANLRASGSASDTSIGLQWDAVPGALHYRVFRNDLGNEPIGDSYDTKAYARGLTPNHSYSFHVAAISTDGKTGKSSNTYTGKTAQRKLTAPTGLHSSAVTKSSFRVTCKGVSGAEIYRWYLNGHEVGSTDNPYRDFTGLKSNTTYSVAVRADLHTQSPGPMSGTYHVKTKK